MAASGICSLSSNLPGHCFRPTRGEAPPATNEEAYRQFSAKEFERHLGWASDTWVAGAFSFSIYSPFGHVPEPGTWDAKHARFHTAPVLAATLSYDNSAGKADVELIFGMNDPAMPPRPLADSGQAALCGFAGGRNYGYAAANGEGIRGLQGISALKQEFSDLDGLHRIGVESGLIVTVPRGTKRVLPLALGFHQTGLVTTGIECSYFYSQYFHDIEDVLAFGLEQHTAYVSLAEKRDAELASQRAELRTAMAACAGHPQLLWEHRITPAGWKPSLGGERGGIPHDQYF